MIPETVWPGGDTVGKKYLAEEWGPKILEERQNGVAYRDGVYPFKIAVYYKLLNEINAKKHRTQFAMWQRSNVFKKKLLDRKKEVADALKNKVSFVSIAKDLGVDYSWFKAFLRRKGLIDKQKLKRLEQEKLEFAYKINAIVSLIRSKKTLKETYQILKISSSLQAFRSRVAVVLNVEKTPKNRQQNIVLFKEDLPGWFREATKLVAQKTG